MKFATELIDPASPSISSESPLLVIERQPERIDSNHRIGDHLKQILRAAAILLKRLDHVDPLLKHGLLAFKLVHIALDLLQGGFLRLQIADAALCLIELPALRHVDHEENHGRYDDRRAEQQYLYSGLEGHRLLRGFRTSLA